MPATRGSSLSSSSAETPVQQVSIADISVPDDRIRSRQRSIDDLAASISKSGLTNPITVDQDMTLVAGHHRLRACKKLGWEAISARVQTFASREDRDLVEIDENLVRHDLTALERAEHLHRKVEILHQKGAMAPAHRPKKGAPAAPFRVTMTDLAAEVGMSKRTLQEDLRIAGKLPDDLRRALGPTILAKDRSWLLQAAGWSTVQQDMARALLEFSRQMNTVGLDESSVLWMVRCIVPVMEPPEAYGPILLEDQEDRAVCWIGGSRAYNPYTVVHVYPGVPDAFGGSCWVHVNQLHQPALCTPTAIPRVFVHGWLRCHAGVGLDGFWWDTYPCSTLQDPRSSSTQGEVWCYSSADKNCGARYEDRGLRLGEALGGAPMLWEDLLYWARQGGESGDATGVPPDLSSVDAELLKTPSMQVMTGGAA